MTERQILLHFEAINRLERRRRSEQLLDVNMAFVGGQKAEQYRKELSK